MTKSGVKIVYVMCTNSRDYLFLLPATSTLTKTTLTDSWTVCIVDRQTRDFALSIGFRLQDWVDEIVVAEAPHGSPMVNSRQLKTSMRALVSGDFLYLDIDAVVVDAQLLSQLHGPCIAASQNIDVNHVTARFPQYISQSVFTPLGWEWPFLPYVNGGVLFCRDNDQCHDLFRIWHERWDEQRKLLGNAYDQTALNRAIWEMPGCLLASALGFLLMLAAPDLGWILATSGFFVLSNSMLRPGVSSLTSKRADLGQGAAMGLSNAYMSLGRVVGPLWAGHALDVNLGYPFITGAAVMALGFVACLFYLPKENAAQPAPVSAD